MGYKVGAIWESPLEHVTKIFLKFNVDMSEMDH